MNRTFALPDLGEGLTEAEIVTWLVSEGDQVVVDQAVAEVETAKAVVEVPTPYAGVVEKLCAGQGETLEVGLPLIQVRERPRPDTESTAGADDGRDNGGPDGAGRAGATSATTADPPGVEPVEPAAPNGTDGSGNVLVGYGTRGTAGDSGPRRRRRPRNPAELARAPRPDERDPAPGTRAPDGVPATSDTRPTGDDGGPGAVRGHPADATRVAMSPFDKAATAAVARSRAEIPEATIWADADFTRLCDLRDTRPDGPGLLAYIARFVTAALAEHPALNGSVDAGRAELIRHAHVHLSLAVQGARGLVAPAVLDADRMTTARLDAALRDLVARARDGATTTRELTVGTFTLNNYGGLGVDGSAPIINHPQVAMLGIGRIIDRPWVVDGQVVPRRIAQVGLVFDHRACDGVEAAAFLRMVVDAIEDPATAIERL